MWLLAPQTDLWYSNADRKHRQTKIINENRIEAVPGIVIRQKKKKKNYIYIYIMCLG